MARRAETRTKQQPASQKKGKIALVFDANVPSYYINYVEVGHSRHDFSILAARTPAKLTPEQAQQLAAGEPILVEPFVHLTVAPTFLPSLIKALQIQMARYEETVRPIAVDGEVK